MPILAFLIDGKKAVFHEGDFDTGDSAERLKEFKEEIKDSSITCDFFATAERDEQNSWKEQPANRQMGIERV